jgi:hypothetical protein
LAHKNSDVPEMAHVEEGVRIKPVNVGQLIFATLRFYGIFS